MHGEAKLRREGLRTRDAHLLEWIAALTNAEIEIISRPEPFPRHTLTRAAGVFRPREPLPAQFQFRTKEVAGIPDPRGARRWWVSSLPHQPLPRATPSLVVGWSPLGLDKYLSETDHTTRPPVGFDLLDDWTIHPAFQGIRPEVEAAYARILEKADVVTCNSEGTLDLATRFGRSDAHLLLNGCDYERFQPPPIVGYGGKIGFRLDLPLIAAVTRAMPEASFEFAGPVLDKDVGRALRRLPNVRLLGDVPYSEYPATVRSWTIGWVPHRTGEGEIGGDVIKVYEYVAAGLPVFTTPIVGAGRGLSGVEVSDSADTMASGLKMALATSAADAPTLPEEMTWRHKAKLLLSLLSYGIDAD